MLLAMASERLPFQEGNDRPLAYTDALFLVVRTYAGVNLCDECQLWTNKKFWPITGYYHLSYLAMGWKPRFTRMAKSPF